MINQPCVGLMDYGFVAGTTEIDSLQKFPIEIQTLSKTFIKNSLTEFEGNMKFSFGKIIDFDKLLKKDSNFQMEYTSYVPKYELFYELTDTSLGIQKYCFILGFSEYTHLMRMNWPWKNYEKKSNFIDPKLVKAEAIKYAKSKNYKTDTCIYELKYDIEIGKLCWYISFLQISIGDKYNYSKEYKTIVIDAILLNVLEELEMVSRGYSD